MQGYRITGSSDWVDFRAGLCRPDEQAVASLHGVAQGIISLPRLSDTFKETPTYSNAVTLGLIHMESV